MTKTLLKQYLIGLLLIGGMSSASAQDVFLQGTYMEVGVSPGGSLGTDNNAPGGFNTTGQLGFIADVDKDGWTEGQPGFVGDYFMPGSPEEGWSLEWTVGGTEFNFNNVYLEGEDDMPVQSHLDKSYGAYKVSEWIGNAVNDTQSVQIKQVLQFHKDSLQFSFTVTLKNTGNTILESLEYMRNLDPDQEEPITGDYTTRNYVKHQPGVGGNTDTAMVVAEALSYSNYKMIIASINSNAVVSTEGFDNRDPDEILDSPNAPSKLFPEEEDQAIAIAYRFGNLAPGDSVVFTYFYILKEEQIAVVTPNTINTATVTPTMFCPGTATSVSVPFNATGTFNAGNVFTAQLSGPTGSFANPTTIGTLSATTSGTINATIPAGAATGSGYRIRVVSSNPVFIGNDNGIDINGGVFVTAANGFSCGSAALTLNAAATSGTIEWYSVPTSGSSIATGTSYTTPTLSTTTTYYVQAVNGACTSERIPVEAVISGSAPTISSFINGTRCGNGKVTLQAIASSGQVKWYDDPTAGSLLYTGIEFQTPTLTEGTTVTYYAEADNGCVSASRTAVDATANVNPAITGTTDDSRCDAGTLDIGATASTGSVEWYSAPTGGTSFYTGTTYTTPSISATTIYYAMAVDNGCYSLREQVYAEIIVPEVTEVYEGTSCGAGTVYLAVDYNGDDAFWFDVPTGGTSLVTDYEYTTPSISVTTTYYVEVVDGGCTSAIRTPVRAIIGSGTPSVATTTPATICMGELATISATTTDAEIHWYVDATGGSNIFEGNDFTTPVLYEDTVYYVEAYNGCNSSDPRIAVEVEVNICTGVAVQQVSAEVSGMSVFPNPNQGSFEILTDKITEGTMDLTDHTGRIILSRNFRDGKITVENPELANGFYIVRIKNDDRIAFQKIVISK